MIPRPSALDSSQGITYLLHSKEYALFLDRCHAVPIYFYPWWISASVGNPHTVRIWMDAPYPDSCVAVPLWEPIKDHLLVPPYCQQWGALWASSVDLSVSASKKRALHRLFLYLSRYRSWQWHLLPTDTDALPYLWQGAEARPYYTHTIRIGWGKDALQAQYSKLTRRKIRQAERTQHSLISLSAEQFLSSLPAHYRKGDAKPFAQSLLRIVQAVQEQQSGGIQAWVDEKGKVRAAVFSVHTPHCLYYIAGWHTPDSSFEMAALMDQLLQQAESLGVELFDFEGSMHSGIATFFRSMGGVPQLYLRLSKGQLSLVERARRKLYFKKNCL